MIDLPFDNWINEWNHNLDLRVLVVALVFLLLVVGPGLRMLDSTGFTARVKAWLGWSYVAAMIGALCVIVFRQKRLEQGDTNDERRGADELDQTQGGLAEVRPSDLIGPS